MIKNTIEPQIALQLVDRGFTADQVKEILIRDNNYIPFNDTVVKVYGKRLLAEMYKLIETKTPVQAPVKVEWVKGIRGTVFAYVGDIVVKFCAKSVKVSYKDGNVDGVYCKGALISETKYAERTKESMAEFMRNIEGSTLIRS